MLLDETKSRVRIVLQSGAETRPKLAHHARPAFSHRENRDGSFDSICLQCFATVASEGHEAELKVGEDAHICPGFDLGEVMRPKPTNRKG